MGLFISVKISGTCPPGCRACADAFPVDIFAVEDDRLAVVAYSNGVQTVWPLTNMTDTHRRQARAAVQQVYTGGGTNLGGGLSQGIAALMQRDAGPRQRKLILISDGLANQGITDPKALGKLAADAVELAATVSTVGVGLDFNEILMTTIADHGAGLYYFLEDPQTFARIFDKELQATRTVAASGLEIKISGGCRKIVARSDFGVSPSRTATSNPTLAARIESLLAWSRARALVGYMNMACTVRFSAGRGI